MSGIPGREKNKEWYKPFYYEYSCQLYKKDTHAAVNIELFFRLDNSTGRRICGKIISKWRIRLL